MKKYKFLRTITMLSLMLAFTGGMPVILKAAPQFGEDQLLGYIPFDDIPEEVTNIDISGFTVVDGTLNVTGTIIFLAEGQPVAAEFEVPVTSAVGQCGELTLGFGIDLEAGGTQVT